MKLLLVICVISTIYYIEGSSGDYEQILEPRGITDSIFSWFYGDPENDIEAEDTFESEPQDTASQKTEFPQIDNGKKIIATEEITPKVEPIEDLLKELDEEIKQSSDNEEKKTIFDTLTEIKDNLKKAPSRFVNVMVNNTRRLVDIGNLGSSRRTRSLSEVNSLTGLIQWLLSFFHIFGNYSEAHESLIPGALKYFFTSDRDQSNKVIDLPNIKNGTLNLGEGLGDQELYVIILCKKAKTKADSRFKGKTSEDTINNIEKALGEKNINGETKWLILVELADMYDDDLDDKTKKRIIGLILRICDNKEFEEVFNTMKDLKDPEHKKIWDLFVSDKEKLRQQLTEIEASMLKNKGEKKSSVPRKVDSIEKEDPASKDDKNTEEYYITEVDKNGKRKSKPRKVSAKQYERLFKNASKIDSSDTNSKDVSKTRQHSDDAKKTPPSKPRSANINSTVDPKTTSQVTTGPPQSNGEISQASLTGSPAPVPTESLTKEKEANKQNDEISQSSSSDSSAQVPQQSNTTSPDSLEKIVVESHYPYFPTSELTKSYYDPVKMTFASEENPANELSNILGKIDYMLANEDIPYKMEEKIAKDLLSFYEVEVPLNDTISHHLLDTIKKTGESPKFHIFQEMKAGENPSEYRVILRIFGHPLPEDGHGDTGGQNYINHGNPSNTWISPSTHEKAGHLTYKLQEFIRLQNMLEYPEMTLPINRHTNENLKAQMNDPKFDNLRNEFVNQVTPENLGDQLLAFQTYLKEQGLDASNDKDEKNVIQKYLNDYYTVQ